MSETATQLSGMAGLEAATPARSRRAWQKPTIIKSENQSLASVQNSVDITEDGQVFTNLS